MDLADAFHDRMIELYLEAKRDGYNATRFLQCISSLGGVSTAHLLLKSLTPGFLKLWEIGRLDLSIEAEIIDHPKWHPLFSEEELSIARQRLYDHQYFDQTK